MAATLAPATHVLELPNKMRLSGPLWLGVQQHLYNGWGPLLGGPSEIGGLIIALALIVLLKGEGRWLYGLAALAYIAMIACFFLLNDPVNAAVRDWTPATLPADWPRYRLQWEVGHALACVFGVMAIVVSVAAYRGRPNREEGSR